MAKGAFWIEADTSELVAALQQMERGIKDLTSEYKRIGLIMADDVRQRVPVYYGQHSMARGDSQGRSSRSHDGKGHPSPGWLQSTIKSGGNKRGPWVSIGGRKAPYTMMQEFGGGVFWHKAGAGAIRATNRAHRKLGEAAARAGIKGHIIYTKPRRRAGYFIWNVVYRIRHRLGRELYLSLHEIAYRAGLELEIPANPDIGIKPMKRAA